MTPATSAIATHVMIMIAPSPGTCGDSFFCFESGPNGRLDADLPTA
jgi:hypothetical protein